ncbi:hypothetical protein Sjap_002553 [Stephania japonica]|uniref:Uncharacterized protein n=1 Tax=Stephania japonica TaxID=461633 RepID=A0AAP0KNN5_9MAGN
MEAIVGRRVVETTPFLFSLTDQAAKVDDLLGGGPPSVVLPLRSSGWRGSFVGPTDLWRRAATAVPPDGSSRRHQRACQCHIPLLSKSSMNKQGNQSGGVRLYLFLSLNTPLVLLLSSTLKFE